MVRIWPCGDRIYFHAESLSHPEVRHEETRYLPNVASKFPSVDCRNFLLKVKTFFEIVTASSLYFLSSLSHYNRHLIFFTCQIGKVPSFSERRCILFNSSKFHSIMLASKPLCISHIQNDIATNHRNIQIWYKPHDKKHKHIVYKMSPTPLSPGHEKRQENATA